MKYFVGCFALAFFAGCTPDSQTGVAEAKVTVRVLDERGAPASRAQVALEFRLPKSSKQWDGLKFVEVGGKTDEKGDYSITHESLDKVRMSATKDGCYKSETHFVFKKIEARKWQPWNATVDLRLKQRVAPVPLYARTLYEKPISIVGEPVGYDLLAGDWIKPHGNGERSDILITLQREFRKSDDYDVSLKLEFPGEGNGLSPIKVEEETPESELRFPRNAPESDYSTKEVVFEEKVGQRGRQQSYSLGVTNYFFRVRSESDGSKQSKRALYGKLVGPIKCVPHSSKPTKLTFTYYLNPEADSRNLEFDTKRNLFGELPTFEQVRAP